MYVVINPEGELAAVDEPATAEAIRKAVGPAGFDLVRLYGEPGLYAYVNDDGYSLGLPRNPAGACVIASLGAKPYVYVGPVVITGWEEPSDGTEIRDLTGAQVDLIRELHDHVSRALGGESVRFVGAENWSDQMAGYAEHVRTGPLPTLTFETLGVLPTRGSR